MSHESNWLTELVESFPNLPRTAGSEVRDVPREVGVYAWWEQGSNCPLYIGSGKSKSGGLRRRIGHHLNPKTLENRMAIVKGHATIIFNGRPHGENSVFR